MASLLRNNFVKQGLAQELSQEGACDRAIFPDSNILITRCAMVGNLNVDGVSKTILLYLSNSTFPFIKTLKSFISKLVFD